MTGKGDSIAISDDLLTAYLDGELDRAARENVERLLGTDPQARDRLAQLASGTIGLRQALDHLLDAAPHERLDALAPTNGMPPPPATAAPGSGRARWALAATVAGVLLIFGGAGGFMLATAPPTFLARMLAWGEWEETVARQVSLYAPASLDTIRVDAATQKARLAQLSATLDLDLSASRVTFPGLTLKRVEQLQIDGRPLAQLLYESDLGPIALCILRETDADGDQGVRRISGMNLVYWSAGAHGFLLVGRAPAETMRRIADAAAQRFSS